MKLYYRISDKSYEKSKLPGATKEVCLMNFIKAFHEIIFSDALVPPMTIIADKCERKTIKMLSETGIPMVITDYGNAGSLKFALELAIKECQDDEIVYFCEDDYLHLGIAPKLLTEVVKRTDYMTLYDHPDKYMPQYNGGEFSKVIKTTSSHWRYTISTCMTFATTVKIIKEDLETWIKYTDGHHPHDHQIFSELNKEKRRRLAVCIPGVACHIDLEYSNRTKKSLIEPWAIDLMISELKNDLDLVFPDYKLNNEIRNKSGMDKLLVLDSLLKSKR